MVGSAQVSVVTGSDRTASRRSIAGLPVAPSSVRAAAEAIVRDAGEHTPRVYAFVNAYSATLAHKEPAYLRALREPTTVGLPDGSAVSIAARLLGYDSVGRCPGPDVLVAVASAIGADGPRSFFLGGGEGVAERLVERLRADNPSFPVAGSFSPPYGEWDALLSAEMVARVRASGGEVLWLGVSAPKQEVWAAEHLAALGIPVVCVGAAFDFLSGSKPRAPRWVRTIGMEWVFRLLTEPRRLWRRYLIGNVKFLYDVFRYRRQDAARP